ncbi:MAG: delta(1)-pyrroline-2-carboxylate reductase family protein [Limnohabitans sp.]
MDARTASALPYEGLAAEIEAVLRDSAVQVPERRVMPLAGGASLFVMPARDGRVAMTKLITFTPANAGTGRPAIQGDVLVFDEATGQRVALLDGPTVTARRTAAVSLLAAQRLAAMPRGPMLIVGAGVQGRAHLEAFAEGLGVREFFIASRTLSGAQALVDRAAALGCRALAVPTPDAVQARCPLVVTCTPAQGVVLRGDLHPEVWLGAVGAFKPSMIELDPALTRTLAARGRVVVDTQDAEHEAGDLIQAGVGSAQWQTLAQVLAAPAGRKGAVLFKSCGWAGWDLAAARLATRHP